MSKNQTLQHKRSSTAGNRPTTAQIQPGELAINFPDLSIYTSTGTAVIELERNVIKSATQPLNQPTGTLWWNSTDSEYMVFDGTNWVNIVYNGSQVEPTNTTSSAPTTGSGTQASPYVITANSTAGATQLMSTITVTGLAPGQIVPIVDNNSTVNGNRFRITNNIADATGTLVFNIMFVDFPASTSSITYTANIVVGTGSAYITVNSVIAAVFPQPVSMPIDTVAATTVWSSPADTLTSTGSLTISKDGTTFNQGPLAISTGDTLSIKWLGAAGSGQGIDGAHGSTIIGSVVSSSGGIQSSSLTIDKTPAAIVFTSQTGVALTTQVESNIVTVSGINSYAYLTSSNVVDAAIGGASYSTVQASGTSLYAINGQSLRLRQTSSGTVSTATTVTVAVGGTNTSFTVTTGNNIVNTPAITTPVDGSVGVSTTATIVASAYSVTGVGVGTHQSSDWQISTDAAFATIVASSLASTTDLTNWTPSGLVISTQYWVRVRYRSSNAVVSAYSTPVSWTTISAAMYPLTNTSTDPTNSSWRSSNPGYTFTPFLGIDTPAPITNAASMFANSATFNDPDISTWNTASFTNTVSMFANAQTFNGNLANWNVANVTNTSNMFANAQVFNGNVATWNVARVTNTVSMFANARAFNGNVATWNVANVTNTSNMFNNARVFNSNLASWNVANVTNTSNMFASANVFNGNIVNWNVSKVANTVNMFLDANVFNQQIGNWNVANVTDMGSMFAAARAFNGDLANWNVANVTNMGSMFAAQPGQFNSNIANWNVSNVTNMSGMFSSQDSFNQPIGGWNVSKVTNMSYMFNSAENFNGNIANWNVANVANMTVMFSFANSFNQPIGNWNVANVTNMSSMFQHANVFNSDIANWNVSKVTNMSAMFYNSEVFNGNIANWSVSNVANMYGMFANSKAFNSDIGNWNVSKVTNMQDVFRGALVFNQPIGNWNVANVTTMARMFDGAPDFNQNIGSWNTVKVTDLRYTFANATSFNCGEASGVVHTLMQRTSTTGWRTQGISSTNMSNMFLNATSFAGNISNWCVNSISSSPSGFATGANANFTVALQPTWNSCPFPD